jgi:hypothetical protein
MLDTAYDKQISDEVKRLNRKHIAHMKRVGRGLSGGALSGGAGLADLLQIPMQLMSLPLKMLGIGGAVPVGAGYGGAMSGGNVYGGAMSGGAGYGGAMSGGAGLGDLIQIPLKLLSGILGGNIPSPETRFGSNPATWSPNQANYAKGGGVYGRGVSGGFKNFAPPLLLAQRLRGGAESGGATSGGASSGGRKRRGVSHRRRGGALLQGFEGGALSGGFESGGFSSGGFSSGGRGPSAKSKAAAKHNPWIAHVKKVQKEHGCSYSEAMKLAKHTY